MQSQPLYNNTINLLNHYLGGREGKVKGGKEGRKGRGREVMKGREGEVGNEERESKKSAERRKEGKG